MKFPKTPTVGLIFLAGVLLSACSIPGMSRETVPVNEAMDHTTDVQSEKDFLVYMIPHHQEAIDNSKRVLAQTASADLQKLAQNVVTTQTSEVAQMKKWWTEWYGDEAATETAYTPMMGDLEKLSGIELERAYVEGMIAHHQDAINMAEQVLTLEPRPEIHQMAEDIIAVQTKEINMLREWLKAHS